MATTMPGSDLEIMRAEKTGVARNSVLIALAITGLKIVVGATTGSLGILSEAAHSGLDLVAAIITWVSVRVSDKPADADHQYGHGKVENFSAFIETGLLLLTCAWIIWEAAKRLFFHERHVEPTVAAFVVMVFSIIMDYGRSRALRRVAIRYNSQALQADALHFSTDIWSSSVVILGLALVAAGEYFHIAWLGKADPIAALGVAAIVTSVSWRLARQTIDALLDAGPVGARLEIMDRLRGIDGVLDVDRVRIRRSGNRFFADIGVALDRNVTFARSEQVASAISGAVQQVIPGADVVAHPVPRASVGENIFDRIRAVVSRHNLTVHDVSVQDLGGNLHVEQHLELSEGYTLKQAHDLVCEIEAEIQAEVPEINSILTHIEHEPRTIEAGEQELRALELEPTLRRVAADFPEVVDVHEVVLKRVRDRLYLSCHCTLQDDLPLSRVHDVLTELEIRFKQAAPDLFKVLIHPEPQTDNRR